MYNWVFISDCICDLQDYWSTDTSQAPPSDADNNFELVDATEMGGYTSVKFERNLTTGESNLDVQFMVRLYNKYSRSVCGRTLISTEGAGVYGEISEKPFSETPFHGLYKTLSYYRKFESHGYK